MRFKPRLPFIGAALAIGVAITLVTATVVTGAGPLLASPDQAGPTDGLFVEAEFYSQRFGVTVDEALRRFTLQDIGRPLMSELEMNEPETYAGIWLQHTPDF